MGKSKGGSARRKGGKGDAAKVASKTTSTLSKRQEKKSQVRKAAARERKGALLSQLETRCEADAAAARGPLLGGVSLGLDDALAEVAAAPARSEKNRPNAANNRGRRVIAAQETERFGAVLKDARFRADPLGAVLGHLRATLPAPAGAAPTGRRKKGSR